MPPPDGIEVCHAGDVAFPGNGEDSPGEGYDHWDRLGKAGLSGSWGDAGWRAGVSQESVTGALLGFLAKQPPAVVAMEACATAHGWGRAISGLGHEVLLTPPIYVKPFVRRQKNDAADAEAIPYGKWPTAPIGVGNGYAEGGIIAPLAISLPYGFTTILEGELDYLKNPVSP